MGGLFGLGPLELIVILGAVAFVLGVLAAQVELDFFGLLCRGHRTLKDAERVCGQVLGRHGEERGFDLGYGQLHAG